MCDEDTLNDIFIVGVDSPIRQSLQSYSAMLLQANFVDMGFPAKSFFAIQQGSGNPSRNNQQ